MAQFDSIQSSTQSQHNKIKIKWKKKHGLEESFSYFPFAEWVVIYLLETKGRDEHGVGTFVSINEKEAVKSREPDTALFLFLSQARNCNNINRFIEMTSNSTL